MCSNLTQYDTEQLILQKNKIRKIIWAIINCAAFYNETFILRINLFLCRFVLRFKRKTFYFFCISINQLLNMKVTLSDRTTYICIIDWVVAVKHSNYLDGNFSVFFSICTLQNSVGIFIRPISYTYLATQIVIKYFLESGAYTLFLLRC